MTQQPHNPPQACTVEGSRYHRRYVIDAYVRRLTMGRGCVGALGR
jgi:hypothetical protein